MMMVEKKVEEKEEALQFDLTGASMIYGRAKKSRLLVL